MRNYDKPLIEKVEGIFSTDSADHLMVQEWFLQDLSGFSEPTKYDNKISKVP